MRRRTSEKRRRAEGRGTGEGASYVPWITIWDGVGSVGWISLVPGRKTGRQHHMLSDNERFNFYLEQDHDHSVDLREQFPLPLALTVAIAKWLGVRHPRDERGELRTMTVDLVLTLAHQASRPLMLQVKPEKELQKPRIAELLEITRLCAEMMDCDWEKRLDSEVRVPRAYNLAWADEYYDYDRSKVASRSITEIGDFTLELLSRYPDAPLRETCTEVDRKLELDPGSALGTVRHLIARKSWIVDMTAKIEPERPLPPPVRNLVP